jgi:hypothetical protein
LVPRTKRTIVETPVSFVILFAILDRSRVQEELP